MTPALEAAFRLSCTLPVRTHHQRELRDIRSTNRNRRPLTLNGVEYASISAAARGAKVSAKRLYTMLFSGEIKEGQDNVLNPKPRGRKRGWR